jgi:hypothetical protein
VGALKAIFGAIYIFLIVGIIYPTPAHIKLKLDKRWKSFVALLVAGVIGTAIAGTSDNKPTAAPADTNATATTTTATTTSTKAETKPASTPAPKPAPAPAPKTKQWTKVIEFTGDQSNSPSDRFQLTGGDVKMEWEITPENSYAKDMVVMGGSLNDNNNNPVDEFISNPGQTKGEWKVYGVQAGTYYFKPNTANGHWKATIYEMK